MGRGGRGQGWLAEGCEGEDGRVHSRWVQATVDRLGALCSCQSRMASSRCSGGSSSSEAAICRTTLCLSDTSPTARSCTPAGHGGRAACISASEFIQYNSAVAPVARRESSLTPGPARTSSTKRRSRTAARRSRSTSTRSSAARPTRLSCSGGATPTAIKLQSMGGSRSRVGARKTGCPYSSPRATMRGESAYRPVRLMLTRSGVHPGSTLMSRSHEKNKS